MTRNKFSSPVFGFGHESALELLLSLADRLLLLLLRVIGRKLGLLSTANESEEPPQKYDDQTENEGEYTGQKEAPPFPFLEADVDIGSGCGDENTLGRLA